MYGLKIRFLLKNKYITAKYKKIINDYLRFFAQNLYKIASVI